MSSLDVCFVCASRADTEPVHTTAPNADDPAAVAHFPFLRTSRPPPGVAQAGDEVQACHLCAELLMEQWRMHDRRNVPVANRQYWVKAWLTTEGSSGSNASGGGLETSSSPPTPAAVVSKIPKTPAVPEPSSANTTSSSSSKTCTMCAHVVGKDCLKINPILLTLVPDFAPRFAPSMLTTDAQLCSSCQRNDGLKKVMQLVGAEQASLGSLMYEMLMRQAGEIRQAPLVAPLTSVDSSTTTKTISPSDN